MKQLAASLFSGGGIAELLLRDELHFVHGVEYDPEIAAVAVANGAEGMLVQDVCVVDFGNWPRLCYLHASPVCTRASAANPNATESDVDIATAKATVRCIEATRPDVFTLENVEGYKRFAAFQTILSALYRLGYNVDARVLDAADYGVPQNRRRLIVRALAGKRPLPPWPIKRPHVGWYDAIADLLPSLPDSQLAPWQVARLPQVPSTVLMDSQNQSSKSYRNKHQTSFTINAVCLEKGAPRAVLVECRSTTGGYSKGLLQRDQNRPSPTVVVHRTMRDLPVVTQGERVVKLTPRALARLQSVPDWYVLPEEVALAGKIIGNGVPPLLMRQIVLPLLQTAPEVVGKENKQRKELPV